MSELRLEHGTVFPSAPDRFPDVQHLVSPIVGMLRYYNAVYPDANPINLEYVESRLAFLLEMAEDVDLQLKAASNG